MITWRGQCIEKKNCVTFSKKPSMWEAPRFGKEAETALTEISVGKARFKSTRFKIGYFD